MRNKGITLIALVITIIILIILASVSINLLFGQSGIITRAKEASEMQEIAKIREQVQLDILSKQAERLEKEEQITQGDIEQILIKYGTINYEGTTIKSITTAKGSYEILYKDIYIGKLEVATYTATFSGTNITSNGANTVKQGDTYTATLTIESGYEIETITVKMGGTELVENTGYIYTDSTITIPSVNGNIEITASAKIRTIAASNIEADPTYIGKYVNYGGQETFKGVRWRIYNAENGKIQLIADNYIYKDVIPTATNIKIGKAEGESTDYCIRASGNRIALLNYINTTSNWSDFVAVTGATVTGGPTLEQFKNSYNRTHGISSEATVKEIFIAKSAPMADGLEGFYVGTSENPETIYVSESLKTDTDNLYIINDEEKAGKYWLGSPSAANTSFVMNINGSGGVGCGDYYIRDSGLRPLVTLPYGITLVQQANGTYNIPN